MKKLTTGKMWLFAIGQFGWSLLSGLIGDWLVYFYQPNESTILQGQTIFIPQGLVILGILTVIGAISAIGRVFDAVTDPWIASLSDRCKSPNGRRIPFLKFAAFPLAISTVLVFCAPIGRVSWINALWLFVCIMLYYLSITTYCTPYNALIPELGHTQEERLNISTTISVTFFVGTAVAYAAPVIWGALEGSIGRIPAMRATIVMMAILAFICMEVPVFAIKEKEYVLAKPVEQNALSSLIKTFQNKDFKVFVCSDILYWVALTMFQTGLPFFVTSLLGLEERMSTIYFVAMSVLSLLFYVPVNMLSRKIGKKKMVLSAFAIFSLAYLYTTFVGETLGFSTVLQGFVLVVLGAIPMAIFGILPNVMVADIAESDAIEVGEKKEGMFYAARTFAFKLGQSLAMLIFTAVATIGSNGTGYRLVAAISCGLCILGGVILCFYNENKINHILEQK